MPPLLHFGWQIEADQFLRTIQEEFPDDVYMDHGTPKQLMDISAWRFGWIEDEADDDESRPIEGASVLDTAYDESLWASIRKRIAEGLGTDTSLPAAAVPDLVKF